MIVLIGFMGAGKTTTGRALGHLLGIPAIDTDYEIAMEAGKGVAEIFSDDGQKAFRALEAAIVERVLQGPEAVVSLGGGAILDPAVRGALAEHTVVHLEVGVDEAIERIGDTDDRPLLRSGDVRALAAQRAPIYEQLASFGVDTSGKDPQAVAEEVRDLLASYRGTG